MSCWMAGDTPPSSKTKCRDKAAARMQCSTANDCFRREAAVRDLQRGFATKSSSARPRPPSAVLKWPIAEVWLWRGSQNTGGRTPLGGGPTMYQFGAMAALKYPKDRRSCLWPPSPAEVLTSSKTGTASFTHHRRARARDYAARSWRNDQTGGSSRLAWNSAKYLANIASVSITSVKPACISLMVETTAGGPGLSRP